MCNKENDYTQLYTLSANKWLRQKLLEESRGRRYDYAVGSRNSTWADTNVGRNRGLSEKNSVNLSPEKRTWVESGYG